MSDEDVRRVLEEGLRVARMVGNPVDAMQGNGEGRLDPQAETEPTRVQPLGHRSGYYFFIDAAGQLTKLSASALTSSAGLLGLFGGDMEWLETTHPKLKGGRREGFAVIEAASDLMRRCWNAGLFDETIPIRGRGVWPGLNGAPIVHCGGGLFVEGRWCPAGRRLGGAIYPATPAMTRPAELPADAKLGRELRNAIAMWCFVHESAADVVLGFVAQAYLGALHYWRGHLAVVGPPGVGKTWLARFVAAVLGPMAVAMNDATEAGLRQTLSSEARALILDEAESDVGRGRVARVIELLRLMSSASGALSLRGSVSGDAQRFSVAGAAYLSAVRPPELKAQDRSRITEIELRSPSSKTDPGPVQEAIERFEQLAPELWARAIAGVERFRANFATWRRVLVAHGCDPRQAEQPAVLLAGHDMMVDDRPTDEAHATARLPRYRWMIRTVVGDADETSASLCLQHLYGSIVAGGRADDQRTVGQLLSEAQTSVGYGVDRILASHGMQLKRDRRTGEMQGIWIANRNPGLGKLFAETEWAGSGWQRDLKRLPAARAESTPIRIGGAKVRVTFVPKELLPPPNDRADETNSVAEDVP